MAATFSYAQAAKGQTASSPSTKSSSAGPSGSATPASTAATETTAATTALENADNTRPSHPDAKVTVGGEKSAISVHDQIRAGPKPGHALGRNTDAASSNDTDSVNDSVVSKDNKSDTKASSIDTPTDGQEANGDAQQAEDKTPPKPMYHEAKPPSVNVWAQRAADLKLKQPVNSPAQSSQPPAPLKSRNSAPSVEVGPTPEADGSRHESRRKSDQLGGRDSKRGDLNGRPREGFRNNRVRRDTRGEEGGSNTRSTPPKPRDRASSELIPPSVSSPVAWPKPEDARDDERKRADEKDRVGSAAAKPHGKTEWKHMPYTPTAIFETRIEGKAGPRVGKGTAKPGAPVNTRTQQNGTATETQRSPVQPALPNGDHHHSSQASARSEREVVPSLAPRLPNVAGAAGTVSENATAERSSRDLPKTESRNIDSHVSNINRAQDQAKASDTTQVKNSSTQLDATRSFEPGANGYGGKRASVQIPTDGANHSVNAHDSGSITSPRSAHPERRSEPHLYDRETGGYRESKRGNRKGLGRGGNANGHFGSPNLYSNGFQDFNAPPFSGPPPSGYYGGRGSGRGYRNQGMRSQSIPIDTSYPRQVPGYGPYPLPSMPQFMPEFYGPGPFSAGPYPGAPNTDRDFLVAQVLQQVEYYLSIDNLLKDIFLRKHMDSNGWIFLHVVASFNRMKQLTTDYDVLKSACLQSGEIEIRVGEDGKERLRKVRDWEQWVLPIEERDASAKSEGPASLRQVSPVRIAIPNQQPLYSPGSMPPHSANRVLEHSFHLQDAASAPFFPGAYENRFDNSNNVDEPRGRQVRPPHRQDGVVSPLVNGFGDAPADPHAEQDRFPSSQIETLTVLVRKPDAFAMRPALHNAGVRTFSNGSIDSSNIMEEMKSERGASAAQINGDRSHDDQVKDAQAGGPGAQLTNDLSLFWVKDQEKPIDVAALPTDTTHELYHILRSKALTQRDAAATGNCPYDLDVLYQFWSHFLVRNFNSQMYYEFKTLAKEDAAHRHSDAGLKNLINYYNGALSSQVAIRDAIVKDLAELIKAEVGKPQRPTFAKLRESWQRGSLNLKNRKKLADLLDESIKSELEA